MTRLGSEPIRHGIDEPDGWVETARVAKPMPGPWCLEEGCERPEYLDGRCKKHRDWHLYRTRQLELVG